MYQLPQGIFKGVLRDGAFIPEDTDNRDWADFLAWQAAGNTPDPAIVPPPAVPESISERQFMQQLATMGLISWDDALAYLGQGVIPQKFADAIATLPADQQNPVKVAFVGANEFLRHNPTTIALGGMLGMTSDQLDALWIAAAAIQ